MNSPADALMRLGSLAKEDRAWIIAQLPPDTKARLLSGGPPVSSSTPNAVPGADESDLNSPRRLVAEADAAHVTHALRTEPAWVLAAILSVQFWPWQARLLASLPEWTRQEVQRLASTTYTSQLLDSILRLVQQKVANCRAPQPESGFARLIAKMSAARVRKRWSVYP